MRGLGCRKALFGIKWEILSFTQMGLENSPPALQDLHFWWFKVFLGLDG